MKATTKPKESAKLTTEGTHRAPVWAYRGIKFYNHRRAHWGFRAQWLTVEPLAFGYSKREIMVNIDRILDETNSI